MVQIWNPRDKKESEDHSRKNQTETETKRISLTVFIWALGEDTSIRQRRTLTSAEQN